MEIKIGERGEVENVRIPGQLQRHSGIEPKFKTTLRCELSVEMSQKAIN